MKLGNNFTRVLSKFYSFPEPLGEGNYQNFDKTQVRLFPNFTSTPFDYLLISWVTNYTHDRGFFTCFLYRELYALKSLKPAFWLRPGLNVAFYMRRIKY